MKKLNVVILVALSIQSFAQSTLSIGVIGSTDITNLHTPKDSRNNPSLLLFDKPSFGYQTGIRAKVDINTIISFQMGFDMVSHTISSGQFPLKPADPQDPDLPEKVDYVVTYKKFQVPLIGSFYFGNTFRYGFTVGVAYNYVYRMDEQMHAYFSTQTKNSISTQKIISDNQYLSAIAGLGVEYQYKKWLFRLEPTTSLQMTSFYKIYGEDQSRLWSAGIALSSFYRLQ